MGVNQSSKLLNDPFQKDRGSSILSALAKIKNMWVSTKLLWNLSEEEASENLVEVPFLFNLDKLVSIRELASPENELPPSLRRRSVITLMDGRELYLKQDVSTFINWVNKNSPNKILPLSIEDTDDNIQISI